MGRKQYGKGVWSAASLYRILNNEAYIGTMYWNKYQRISKTRKRPRDRAEWLAIPVPPILSQEVFEAAQQKLRTQSGVGET